MSPSEYGEKWVAGGHSRKSQTLSLKRSRRKPYKGRHCRLESVESSIVAATSAAHPGRQPSLPSPSTTRGFGRFPLGTQRLRRRCG